MARRWIVVAAASLILGLASSGAARAQSCPQTCDPYTTACNTPCDACLFDYPDGYCPSNEVYSTTCGDYRGACVPENCTPDWVLEEKTQIGAWKSSWGLSCNYYHSFMNTECDSEQCNINSNYYCRDFCTAELKGYYYGSSNCCSIFSNLGGCWGITCS
jgi:hypothetical protein